MKTLRGSYYRVFRFTVVSATAAIFTSACVPPGSSHGTTDSPYYHKPPKPVTAQNQSAGSHPTTGTGSPSGQTPHPGVPGASGATGVTGPTGPTGPVRPDAKKSLIVGDDQALDVSFKEAFLIPMDIQGAQEFGPDGCREVRLQSGQFIAKPDSTHFSCSLHYCVFKPGRDESTRMRLKIVPTTRYIFEQTDASADDAATPHVTLQWISGSGHVGKSGMIDQLNCDGYAGSLTVEDLIEAFGPGKNGDTVDVRVIKNPQHQQIQQPARPGVPPKGAVPPKVHAMNASPSIRVPSSVMNSSVPDLEMRNTHEIDWWNYDRPNFALQISGSPAALGNSKISPTQSKSVAAILVQLEYQPKFLQKLGIFSLGPSFAAYPSVGVAVGGQARYQFHYWHNQLIVPYAAYEIQYLKYGVGEGGSGGLAIAGGSAGASLLLNRLAPSEAWNFYHNSGVSRTYFIVEGRSLSGSDTNVSVPMATSVFVGLRFER